MSDTGRFCPDCRDATGWVLLDTAGRSTVRPCSICSESSYKLWQAGHLEPNHSCPTCEERHRGRRKKEKGDGA